jgi:serine/threonine protein kinase
MFCTADKDSQLRLIDFGSGRLDGDGPGESVANGGAKNASEVDTHHTFAGSGFYISPEMFQHTYTSKTDVWSAGVTLYVLAAGYPADRLQETFDVIQGSKVGRLRKLPNLPHNIPDSFYDMLEGALTYRHKSRMDAKQLMQCEFSQFHIQHEERPSGVDRTPGTISITEIAAEAAAGGEFAEDDVAEIAYARPMSSSTTKRTTSVVLEGSVNRHNAYLGYQKFERSVTTVLATMLAKDTCRKFLMLLREKHDSRRDLDTSQANIKKLKVVTIKVLLELLENMTVADDREVKEVCVYRPAFIFCSFVAT